MKKALILALLCVACASPAMAAIERCRDISTTMAVGAGDQQRFLAHSWSRATITGSFTAAAGAVGASVRMGLYHSSDGVTWYPLHYADGDSVFTIPYVTGATNKFQYHISNDYYSTTAAGPLPTPDLCIGQLKVVLTNTSLGTNKALSAIDVYVVHN